jgi:hypothetical protein
MDDPNDFKPPKLACMFRIGDLVSFMGYHYSPDYIYIDGDDYQLGIIVSIIRRQFHPKPIYKIFWFKKGFTTEAIEDHLRLVVIKKTD